MTGRLIPVRPAASRTPPPAPPPIFACNGRQDGAIPGENNPPFYAVAIRSRHAFAVYWNDGPHLMQSECPADALAWESDIYRYRLDESYPVFTNCSDDKNYGNGDATDGDPIGWINRGLGWTDLRDTADEYALTVTAAHPDIVYPVTVDVTPRRLQRFAVEPGETLSVRVAGSEAATVKADEEVAFTVPGLCIPAAGGSQCQRHPVTAPPEAILSPASRPARLPGLRHPPARLPAPALPGVQHRPRGALLPANGFLVTSPAFVAFHAKRYNGIDYDPTALFTLRSLDGLPIPTSKQIRVFHGFGPRQVRIGPRVFEVEKEQIISTK